MAGVSSLAVSSQTTNSTYYQTGSFTPAASSVLVAFVAASGTVAQDAFLEITTQPWRRFTQITTAQWSASTNTLYAYIANGSCDGQACVACQTDPTNQSVTSFQQSDGQELAPCLLPWYVLPETPNPVFDYANRNIAGGQLGLVVYGNSMSFGVFGDERAAVDRDRA